MRVPWHNPETPNWVHRNKSDIGQISASRFGLREHTFLSLDPSLLSEDTGGDLRGGDL